MCLASSYTSSQTGRPAQQQAVRKVLRPRLPRKLTSSAKVNLNRLWTQLELLVPCHVTMPPDSNNVINDNLDNERRERQQQQQQQQQQKQKRC